MYVHVRLAADLADWAQPPTVQRVFGVVRVRHRFCGSDARLVVDAGDGRRDRARVVVRRRIFQSPSRVPATGGRATWFWTGQRIRAAPCGAREKNGYRQCKSTCSILAVSAALSPQNCHPSHFFRVLGCTHTVPSTETKLAASKCGGKKKYIYIYIYTHRRLGYMYPIYHLNQYVWLCTYRRLVL